MTSANKVTLVRLLLVPVFLATLLYYLRHGKTEFRWLSFACFATASVLDGVDGFIARRYHQISEVGKVLDPLADKLLMVSALVVLSFNHGNLLGQIPLWLMIIIIARDLTILIGMLLILSSIGSISVRPRLPGKIATVLQMAVVIVILLRWDVPLGNLGFQLLSLAAALFTALSGLLYVRDGVKQFSRSPEVGLTPLKSSPDAD